MQLAPFLLHFSMLTQQLYLSKASVFERSFENLNFFSLGSQNNSQKKHVALNCQYVSIQVFGSGGSANLTTTTITPKVSTQTYSPSSSYDGYSSVTVNGDSNLVPSNIVSRKSIFGVSGSLIKNEIAFITGNNFVHYSSGSLSRWEWTINFSWEKILFCVFYLEATSTEWITEIHVTPIVKNSLFKEAFDDCKGI